MRKKGLIKLLVLVIILVIVGFFWFSGYFDSDITCVPASCCHPSSCVVESEALNCSGVVCSSECRGGTMDCGAGHCEYVDGSCEVVWNEG